MGTQGKSGRWWKFTASLIAGLAAGAGAGFAIGRFLKHSHKVSHVDGSEVAALTLTAFYIGMALILFWVAGNRMRLARMLEGKSADVPASDREVRSFRYQALVMALAAILLALPVFGARLFHADLRHGGLYFAGIALLFAVQTFYNIRLWQISDEFLRGTIVEAAAWTFAIGQGGLFLWSAAEHMSLVKPTSAWDLTIDMMLLYLFVGSIVSVRTARRE